MRTILFIISFCVCNVLCLFADDIEVNVEAQTSLSDGKTPLWLNANKYGLSSLESSNGYFRASAVKALDDDFSKKRLELGYGLDLATAYNYTSNVVVQQAFVEAKWLKGVLSVGSKEWAMEMNNNELSSGAQTFGKNARPVPQVRLALADWWALPKTDNWLKIKMYVSYGMMTDDNWQADFTQKKSKYTENTLYQSKAGYLKIGNEEKGSRVSLTMGIETASLFGGTSYQQESAGGIIPVKNSSSLSAFWHAFFPGGADAQEIQYQNIEGDVLGSWVIRLDYDADDWTASVYGDHFFEDHSAMFHLDYDGYGKGDEWNVKKDNRYILYALKDMMIGLEWKKKQPSWLDNVVAEYLYTKYQSGSVYHDHTQSFSDHIGGADNYYNHYIWAGWQHWGQVIGNPIYLSPIYNEDGLLEIKNNRFAAYHLALGGHPMPGLSYRLMATWQDAMGTYRVPYNGYKHSLNMMAETTYRCGKSLDGWWTRLALGMDRGNVHGNNFGVQLTVGKTIKVRECKR